MSSPKQMELGIKQLEWLDFLENNEDKKLRFKLGTVTEEGQIEKAGCLGSLLMTVKPNSYSPHSLNIIDQKDDESSYIIPRYSYKELGLHSPMGDFKELKMIVHQPNGLVREYSSLGEANDQGAPWSEIAEFIRLNPQVVFAESI